VHTFTTEQKQVVSFLRSRNVTVIEAPNEADRVLAQLCQLGIAQAVLTEDGDLAAAPGVPIVLRGFKRHLGANATVQEFNKAAMLQKLKWSEEEFLSFCIWCGCDYQEQYQKGLGPVKLSQRMDQCKALNLNVIEVMLKSKSEEYKTEFAESLKIFKNQRISDLVDVTSEAFALLLKPKPFRQAVQRRSPLIIEL